MRILEIVIVVFTQLTLAQYQEASGEYEQFSCYRCETTTDKDVCNTIDRTCSHHKCAKIKYKEGKQIKIIRECSPIGGAVASDICSDAEQLKGKPCDAWLCDEPLCNGADAPRSAGAAHVHTLAVVVLYFLVAG